MMHRHSTTCPTCHVVTDVQTGIGTTAPGPSPGDHSLCGECGGPAVYDDQLQLRAPTMAELVAMAASPNFQQARAMWRMVRDLRGLS